MKKKRFFVAIDFSRYNGRYVAVVGKSVVASGTNAKQVWLEAKKESYSSTRTSQGPEGRDARVEGRRNDLQSIDNA